MKKLLPSLFHTILFVFIVLLSTFISQGQDTRKWATYLGGSNDDYAYSVATDATGNVYLTGYTVSTSGIATPGSHKSSYSAGAPDAFLIKFDSNGVRLWGTYFGGGGDDQATSVSVDKVNGDIYIAGITYSNTGIALNGFDNTINSGSTANSDAFLAKFNSAGVLQWGTYYGGAGDEEGHAVAVDALGNVYLAGQSSSATTTQVGSGGHQNTYGGSTDAFLVKFNSSGVRQWGTYFGGGGFDCARGISIDFNSNVYLAGHSASISGVSLNGYQNSNGGGRDAILAKFTTNGGLVWATYYGGTGYEEGNSVATDAFGNVYFSGLTSTTTTGIISTPGSFQPSLGGGTYDGFLVKLSADGVTRFWGTYYGGTGFELFSRVAVDKNDNVFLGGFTQSPGGISSGGYQNTYGGNNDGYIAKFTTDGQRVNASYYGGAGIECTYAAGIAPDDFGNVFLAGETGSSADVASGGHQNTYGGGSYDAFLVKFGIAPEACVGITLSTNPVDSIVCAGAPVSFRVTASGTPTPSFQWRKNGANIPGANSNVFTISSTSLSDTGNYSVFIKNNCDSTVSTNARLTVREGIKPIVSASDSVVCSGDSIQVCAATIFVTYQWNNNETSQCFYAKASGNFRVTTTDVNGCEGISDDLYVTVHPPVLASISATLDTLTATSGVSYQWYFEGTEITGATSQSHIAIQDGNYSVEVTDANGCSALSSDYYYTITGINKELYDLSVILIPNPVTSGMQQIFINNTMPGMKCRFFDVSGKLILEILSVSNRTNVNISGISPGLYFVVVGERTVRFVIQ